MFGRYSAARSSSAPMPTTWRPSIASAQVRRLAAVVESPRSLRYGLRVNLLPLFLLTALLAGQTRSWIEQKVIDGDAVVRGLPKDGIPAIDEPVFVTAAEATFMRDDEPVIGVADGEVAKAYSTWLLNGHEIVNDAIGSRSIAVTW